MINTVVDIGLLGLLLATTLLIMRSQSALSITILSSIYSLILCALFVVLDAVDVAFTEAAVGAGISLILFVAVIRHNDEPSNNKPGNNKPGNNKPGNNKLGTDAPGLKSAWPSGLSICLGLALGILLISGTTDMPLYGDPAAAIHHYLAPRFLGQSAAEIGIPNVVTSVLASYRGYDTLGEVVVIFTAGMAVLLLLAEGAVTTKPLGKQPGLWSRRDPLISNPVLKTVLLRFIPIVILFALYVQFHGDYGPGGGFQAGVIFGAGLITFGLLTDSEKLQSVISERIVISGMACGVLLYGSVGVAALFFGGDFLDYSVFNYSVLSESQTAGQHLGVFLIELGVGITVASTIVSLFISFNRRHFNQSQDEFPG
ncbi:Na(+)/H(+) antiporter subunit B [Candidatus Spongiihabitans sp.]|uniref:Na(+)/H(+) antiporter subunit B n=1 Tax=Candidatus Spongiihabitans sp. TaxID=3101308 RepID=UPI003C70584D